MPIKIKDPPIEETLEYINEYFEYSEEHGGFLYKKASSQNTINKVGKRVGSLPPLGYVAVRVNGRLTREHRLVYLLFNNKWPTEELDHIDGDNSNNRISNLRVANREENCTNRKGWGKSKYKGVTFLQRLGKWQAVIKHNKETIYIGLFEDEINAAKAYDNYAIKFHKDFKKLNFKEEQNV